MINLLGKFMRKKVVDREETSTQLNRVLSTFDLTLLGIGSTLGIGVYVLAGSVAKDAAGPAVVISFLVAALASVLAGLCYAEFGSRVPKAGSAYVYSYVCVGELVAFIVGWNLIMEYVIGVASVAKGYSGYVDNLFDHQLSKFFDAYVPIKIDYLSDYFDIFAFCITMVLTVLLAFGVKESSFFNNIFTILNLGVVVFVVVAGSIYADPKNWALKKEDILNSTANITAEKIGEGGFMPFGFHGIMKGAATCFYGFVGFDCIATTGEEAKNPQRSIPFAIVFSLLFIFMAYFSISTVVTMMVPYYLQNSEAPLPYAFQNVDFMTGKWIVTLGAIFGLSTSLLGAAFPLPRVIYAMASDGVLFKFLAKVHPKSHTPLIATLLSGTLGGLMAAIFKLEALIDMMSIGTLTAYTLVAVCVLCLRYRKDVDGADDTDSDIMNPAHERRKITFSNYFTQIYNSEKTSCPTDLSSSYTNMAVIIYCVFTIAFCGFAIWAEDLIIEGRPWPLIILAVLGLSIICILLSLSVQPVSRVKLSFRVPFVPLIPGLSILANTYLVMKLSVMTWIRFSVWMIMGFIIYGLCICNGTTDKAYAASLEDKNKRKYSKVSASGFDNKGLHLSNGKLGANKPGEDGQDNRKQPEVETVALESLLNNSNPIGDVRKEDKVTKCNGPLSSLYPVDSEKQVETETIEKSVEFDDNDDGEVLRHENEDAEKAAVDAIDSVISQACNQAGIDSKSRD